MDQVPDSHICPVTTIIVTHNSQTVFARCLAAIEAQTHLPEQVIVVDSGSEDCSYLQPIRDKSRYLLHTTDNIGFAAANNLGIKRATRASRYLLFLNPDAFLAPSTLAVAVDIMEEKTGAAILGGRLRGCDSDTGVATGRLDSTGIFRKWYGRWYDRGQGERDDASYRTPQQVPALCGAFLFCRRQALESELPNLFDESFFLYKEDIDLCLRIRRRGWQCLYDPALEILHCRGWSNDRRQMSRSQRLLAARNEVRLTIKHRSPYLVWALSKYLLVRVVDV
ncbi:MAG: glycosyltransferase family 2 protein [Desulfofustis sp.]|nr:glycosyltransferase family 2 protein [Desulfofustis sp.]